MITESVLVEKKQIWPTEQLRIESLFRGQCYVGLRKWFASGDTYLPGKSLNLNVRHLPMLRAALATADEQALETNLLSEADYELANLPLPAALGGRS